MRLLVVGGTGYLGRAVVRAAHDRGYAVESVGSASFDLRRPLPRIDADVVINCAYVQSGPDLDAITTHGAVRLAEACAKANVRFIQLSSDLVFAGRDAPYTAADRPEPLDAYGRAKAAMETGVLTQNPDALVVRTSLLWGASEPGAQERLVQRACAGEPIVFFTNEVRSPIKVDVLARRLIAACDVADAGIVHVAGDEALDRLQFAHRVAAHLGRSTESLRGGLPKAGSPPRATRVVLSSTARPWGTG